MRYVTALIIIVLTYAVFTYGRIWYYTHYSKNPPITQTNKVLGSGPPLTYVAAGDSTAVGIGASHIEKTYTYKLAEELAQSNTVSYSNVGVSGARTNDILQSQLSKIVDAKPDIVTISIGANDNTHLISDETILHNYRQIIRELTERTSANIYITNIANFEGARLLPIVFVKILEQRSRTLNPEILKMETDRVKIVNIHDFGWSNYADKQVTYSYDFFHPSDIGYENWTAAFLSRME